MPKYCIECGNTIDDECNFCPNCGVANNTYSSIREEIETSTPINKGTNKNGLGFLITIIVIIGFVSVILLLNEGLFTFSTTTSPVIEQVPDDIEIVSYDAFTLLRVIISIGE